MLRVFRGNNARLQTVVGIVGKGLPTNGGTATKNKNTTTNDNDCFGMEQRLVATTGTLDSALFAAD